MKFEEVIERDGRLVYTNVGDSMLPFIRQDRDLVVIEKPRGRLKKHDVAFYKRDGGEYVLHRVIKVTEDGYVIRGDNTIGSDTGVTDADVIGVLSAFVRDGKTIPVTDRKYRLYARVWTEINSLRIGAGRILRRVKARCRRMFRFHN